jgi:hypothetical protein
VRNIDQTQMTAHVRFQIEPWHEQSINQDFNKAKQQKPQPVPRGGISKELENHI